MKLLWINILSCFFFLTIGCANEEKAETWVTYENEAFKYTVEMPTQPHMETKDMDAGAGELLVEIAASFQEVEDAPNHSFMVSCMNFPKPIIKKSDTLGLKKLFKTIIEGLLIKFKGELLFEKDIDLAGLPVKEIRIEYLDEVSKLTKLVTYRILVKENLQFLIQTSCVKGKDMEGSGDRFLNSFSFTE
jgi:hypothetical protein